MLVIREPQMAALGLRHRAGFDARLRDHLRRFFPERCAALGDVGLDEAIAHGVGRAHQHGLTAERDVCKYVDLMFVFGRDFDLPEQQPWAARILRRLATSPPSARVEALMDKAMRMMHRAFGLQPKGPPP